MPRAYLMSWQGAPNFRWRKMYKGVSYVVTCADLKATVWTQAGSGKLADDWWRKKFAELTGPDTFTRIIQSAPSVDELQERIAIGEAAARILNARKAGTVDEATAERIVIDDVISGTVVNPARLTSIPHPGRRDQQRDETGERAFTEEQFAQVVSKAGGMTGETDRTIGHLVDQWWQTEQDRIKAGKLSDSRATMNQTCLLHFRDWIGAGAPVDTITEAKWSAFYSFLVGNLDAGKWGNEHCDRILGMAKRFIMFAWERRLIELPRNLDKHSFTVEKKEVEIFTDEELAKFLAAVKGQSRLHVLLMLNCGLVAKDINDLRHSEINWTEGTLTRKRSKTKKVANVPTVTYKLWPETFALLKEYRSADPDIVLLTSNAKRWILPKMNDGKWQRSDSVATGLRRYMAIAGVKHAPTCLRATAASKLASHEVYGQFVQHYLGHAPRSVADVHYVRPTHDKLFKALAWLRVALGIASA